MSCSNIYDPKSPSSNAFSKQRVTTGSFLSYNDRNKALLLIISNEQLWEDLKQHLRASMVTTHEASRQIATAYVWNLRDRAILQSKLGVTQDKRLHGSKETKFNTKVGKRLRPLTVAKINESMWVTKGLFPVSARKVENSNTLKNLALHAEC